MDSGYHTLTLQLLDNGALTMGAVEIVRIITDNTTEGSFTFGQINTPGGSIVVNITPEMAEPLDVTISGASAEKPQNEVMTLTAGVENYTGNVSYIWYVNGNSTAIGESFAFDASWVQGYYRIDLTAFSAKTSSIFIFTI